LHATRARIVAAVDQAVLGIMCADEYHATERSELAAGAGFASGEMDVEDVEPQVP
jgi:hypothetical protein